MKLFADTASIQEIEKLLSLGVVQGVTTNPSLLSKEPKADFHQHIQKIADLCKDHNLSVPLSVEVFAIDPKKMIDQAKEIFEKIDYENLNIKIPVGFDELHTIHELSNLGIPVNCTCCFTETQMQLAALSGARYVSLFYNRLRDAGGDPLEALKRTRNFIDSQMLPCEIIAGSIRNPYDIADAWSAGSHIVTAGFSVIEKATLHNKTDESIQGFLNDFEAWIK